MKHDSKPPSLAGPARPRFLESENEEKLWDVVLALSVELAATRARLDALERILLEKTGLPPDALETWQPSTDAATARAQELQAYTQRVFGSLGGA